MTADPVADRMTALLEARARTFYEVVQALPDVEYRTILQAWGPLRERRALGRDEEGRYMIRTPRSAMTR